jgi:hypothetical protein
MDGGLSLLVTSWASGSVTGSGPVHGPGSGPATCEFRKIRCEACYKAMVILLMEELSLSSAQIK